MVVPADVTQVCLGRKSSWQPVRHGIVGSTCFSPARLAFCSPRSLFRYEPPGEFVKAILTRELRCSVV
jgi:hypothetical protein